jgi:glycosyltransferase involved in cell wall biosynthesis
VRVTALTQGKNAPSSRYRIHQCIPALSRHGIDVTGFCPAIPQYIQLPGRLANIRRRYLFPVVIGQAISNLLTRIPGTINSRKADLVWISRAYLPGMEGLVRLTGRPRVLDVDDAIWLTSPRGPNHIASNARRMDAIVVGNDYLANWFARYNRNIEIIPTSVDCEVYHPLEGVSDDNWFTIGWIGTSGNFGYLRTIFRELKHFLDDYSDSRFMMISDRVPDWWPSDNRRMVFCRWSAEEEVRHLNMLDVGLMPLQDSNWTRGKCSFKMLQYLAVGKPVIVSPVGMNKEVLGLGECGLAPPCVGDWYSALESMYHDRTLRNSLAQVGRTIVQNHFSTEVVAGQYARVFEEVCLAKET